MTRQDANLTLSSPDQKRPEPGEVHSTSVGRRLLLAFLGISGFAVLAAAAAMYAFWTNQEAFDRVTEDKVPAALAALELSRQSERIVAAAPALLTVQSPEQHQRLSTRINDEVDQLVRLIDDIQLLQSTSKPSSRTTVSQLNQSVGEIRSNLRSLDTLMEQRLAISAQQEHLSRQLISTHSATERLLEPWLQTTEATITRFQSEISSQPNDTEHNSGAARELAEATRTFRTLQQVQATTASINDQLLQSGSIPDLDRLKVAQFRLSRSLREAGALNQQLHAKLQPLLGARISEYAALVKDEQGIPRTRAAELELLTPAEELLTKNTELSQTLTSHVDTLVTEAKLEISQAREHARLVEMISISVLLTIVGLSLISSGLIVWRYVRANLVRRLTRLSSNMLAIADGDLDVQIEDRGDDEIAGMARALKVFRDTAIEVRETNLRELQEARRRLADAIDSISEGFALFDSQDRLIIHNRRFVDLFPGLEEVVVEGARFRDIINSEQYQALFDENPEKARAIIDERLYRHQNPGQPFLQHYRDGGWIQISERETSSEGTVAVYTDVTELKRHEEITHQAKVEAEAALAELKKTQNSLVQAEKLAQLGQLVAGIAHEIKNPLNFVKNFAEVSGELLEELNGLLMEMKAGYSEQVQQEITELIDTLVSNLGKIQAHGMRADSIIKAMLAHSRGGSHEWQRVDLNRIVEESTNLAYHGARATDATFNVTLDQQLDDELGEIEIVPQDISRVLLNLLSNAFDAVHKRAQDEPGNAYQPRVTVQTRLLSDGVTIVVEDNGSGMTTDTRENIFTPFFTTKPAGKGTGLGLSLSYDIVCHQHGGEIRVESELGHGTCFIVQLPRQSRATAAMTPSLSNESAQQTSKTTNQPETDETDASKDIGR